jgi:hypothetical protein
MSVIGRTGEPRASPPSALIPEGQGVAPAIPIRRVVSRIARELAFLENRENRLTLALL